jgi:hypothetical protein
MPAAARAGTTAAAGRSSLATAGTALGLLLAAGAAVALHLDAVAPEGRWGAVSFPLVWATPALLGVLARRRAVLLVPAALLGAGLAVLSLSGVTLVLLFPAALHGAAAASGRPPWPSAGRAAVLLSLPVGGLAAFGALLLHQDPVCWDVVQEFGGGEGYRVRPERSCNGGSGIVVATATGPVVGGGATSDVVVASEAALSGLLVAGTLSVGWVAAAPVRRP